MLKRLAKYIASEMKVPADLEKIQETQDDSQKVYNDDCEEVTLQQRIDEFKSMIVSNAEFNSRSIESLRKKLNDMCLIVDALNEKRTDEINFMDLVKELTYKINAYEKYEGYQKFPARQSDFNPFDELNSSKCEAQEQSSSESN